MSSALKPGVWSGHARTRQGFTLLELLLVMVIIGIVASILLGFFVNNLRKTQLRDGAVQLLTDVRQARTQAIRTSRGSTVTLASTAKASPNNRYTLSWSGSGVAGSALTVTQRTLPDPIRVAPFSGSPGNVLTYSAPYGEVAAASGVSGVVWEISSSAIADKLYVKAVGVTGKVMLSASAE